MGKVLSKYVLGIRYVAVVWSYPVFYCLRHSGTLKYLLTYGKMCKGQKISKANCSVPNASKSERKHSALRLMFLISIRSNPVLKF